MAATHSPRPYARSPAQSFKLERSAHVWLLNAITALACKNIATMCNMASSIAATAQVNIFSSRELHLALHLGVPT